MGVRSERRDGGLGGSSHGQCEIFPVIKFAGQVTSMDSCIGKISGSDKVS